MRNRHAAPVRPARIERLGKSARLRSPFRRNRTARAVLAAILLGGPALPGCATDAKIQADLQTGTQALNQKQYDQALARSAALLKANPSGVHAAEALYLRGRVFEDRARDNPASASSDWQEARVAYRGALENLGQPAADPKLEARARAGIGNVAYFQDDYATAAGQLGLAFDKLDDAAAKAWALYRLGVSQQRLGRFAEADATFAAVARQFPDTVQAQRAARHLGARTFSVQFATFANPAQADAAANTLRRQGVNAVRQGDPSAADRNYVRVQVPGYEQARALKARFASAFPDALILP